MSDPEVVWLLSQVYFSTLYESKSIQKEDSERVQQILLAVIKQFYKIEEDILLGKQTTTNTNDQFTQSLCIYFQVSEEQGCHHNNGSSSSVL